MPVDFHPSLPEIGGELAKNRRIESMLHPQTVPRVAFSVVNTHLEVSHADVSLC